MIIITIKFNFKTYYMLIDLNTNYKESKVLQNKVYN